MKSNEINVQRSGDTCGLVREKGMFNLHSANLQLKQHYCDLVNV